MTKRYTFINRKTGKKANIKAVGTRDQARHIKWVHNFRVSIFDNLNSKVVR